MATTNDYTLTLLREKFREEMNDIADDIVAGGCGTFEAYQHLTGVIEGFARAERALLDLDEKLSSE